jgi:hypothetical protein
MKDEMKNNPSSNDELTNKENEVELNDLNNQEPINQDNKPNLLARFKNRKTLMIIVITIMVLGLTTTSALYYSKSKNNDQDDKINDDPKDNPIDNDNNNDDDDIGDDTPINSDRIINIFGGNSNYVVGTFESSYYSLKKVGEYECQNLGCKYIDGHGEYIAVLENNTSIYVYNYKTKEMEYGPIILGEFEAEMLGYDGKIYGLVIYKQNYTDDYESGFYSFEKNKITIEPKYELDLGWHSFKDFGFSLNNNIVIGYKNDYAYLLDILTGKEILKIKDRYLSPLYNEKDKNTLVYYTAWNNTSKNSTIYNKNGKLMFNGETFKNVYFTNNDTILITKDSQTYQIRDIDNTTSFTSKKYKEIFKFGADHIFVLDNDNIIKVINHQDELIVTFMEWNENYTFDEHSSGSNDEQIYFTYSFYSDDEDECIEYVYDKKTTKVSTTEPDICGGYGKPLLYLYPTTKTNVTVSFEKPQLLTTTYPKFISKWNVAAYPNGDLYDKNGKYYYGLYWEENMQHSIDFKEGFYVTKDNAISFLEEKLSVIGLSEREANEFIMYWLPILENNKQSLVYFELTEERQRHNKLIISPTPDSLLRVAIHVKRVNTKVNIKEQKLPTFKRQGFVAVEWGGVKNQ